MIDMEHHTPVVFPSYEGVILDQAYASLHAVGIPLV